MVACTINKQCNYPKTEREKLLNIEGNRAGGKVSLKNKTRELNQPDLRKPWLII